jgi:hypothetical protein
MLSLKKLNKASSKEQYQVEISNKFIALENLHVEVEILIEFGKLPERISKL